MSVSNKALVDQATDKVMKNKKGYTLIEILMVLSILGILTGIATVSYRGYILSVNKRNLKQAGIMFATAVNTCIQSMGKWEPRTGIFPCKADESNNQDDDTDKLKSKLDFICPIDAICKTWAKNKQSDNSKNYYCLSIMKEVSGKKLQVITRVPWHNPSEPYQVLCNEITGSYMDLSGPTCKKASQKKLKDKGFAKEIIKADGNKVVQIIPCQWK